VARHHLAHGVQEREIVPLDVRHTAEPCHRSLHDDIREWRENE
jgi:hypothetical protein